MTSSHDLARSQLAQHGVDRYPSLLAQFTKLVTEVGELGDELLATQPNLERVRTEAADIAVSLYHLCDKIGFDLDDAVFQLVHSDQRRFDT